MTLFPDAVWQRVVGYVGLETRLGRMAKRDWRFEEARASVNKVAHCITHLCWRYLYPRPHPCNIDDQWTITLCYWTRVVK